MVMFTLELKHSMLLALLVSVLVAGCGSGQSGGDSGDEWTPSTPSNDALGQIELENGRYVASAGAPPGFVYAVWGETVECGLFEREGFDQPVLFVGIGTYASGEYEIVTDQAASLRETEPRAQVGIVDVGDGEADVQRTYQAISGTVRLESDVRNGGSPVDIRIDATFPEPLIARESCQYPPSRPVGADAGAADAGGTELTCTCGRRDSDSAFECTSDDDNPSCCLDEENWDSTFDFRHTLQARRCDGYGNLADAGTAPDAGTP